MATTTIPWGDGSGDNIYLTYSSASGNQTVDVTSDANTGYVDRTKDITFTVVAGQSVITRTLTVIQPAGSDLIVPVFNGVYPTYNDVARGFDRVLPSAYQAVDYIILNTQIDTGEKTTQDTLIEAEIYMTSTYTTYLWRSDSGSNLTTNTTAYISSNGNWRFGGTTITIPSSSIRSVRHKLSQSSEGVYIDREKVGSYANVSNFTSSSNLLVGSSSTSASVRYYYFRHTKGGTTVSDYEPCIRIADSVAGFYDHIKGVFVAGGSAPSA